MPAYQTSTPPAIVAMYPGDQEYLFNAESTATITTSIQKYLAPDVGTSNVECMIEGFFSGAPGTFELDIQFASTDGNQYYETPTGYGQITAVDANNHFAFKYSPAYGPFVRAYMKTVGNTVNLTVKVTR